MPPGLHQYSVIVSTPNREMKFTAPTKERHDIWLNVCVLFSDWSLDTHLVFQALRYLLAHLSAMPLGANDDAPLSPMSIGSDLADEQNQHALMASPHSHRSGRSAGTVPSSGADSFNNTLKGQRGRSQVSLRSSVGKRSGTCASRNSCCVCLFWPGTRLSLSRIYIIGDTTSIRIYRVRSVQCAPSARVEGLDP